MDERAVSKYTVSQDKKSGLWYAHQVGFDYVPVFGSFGNKAHAMKYARLYNETKGA